MTFLTIVLTLLTKGLKRDVIMLDVDSKDPSVGMSCPPQAFVEEEFLLNIKKLLDNNGMYRITLLQKSDYKFFRKQMCKLLNVCYTLSICICNKMVKKKRTYIIT